MKPSPSWSRLVLGFVFACVVLGQTTAGGATGVTTDTPATTVSANVGEVSLQLAVHDRKHRCILDLKPEEITITDDDSPVKLSDFHLVKDEDGTDHVVTLVFEHFDGSMAKTAQSAATKVLQMFPSNGYRFAVLDYGQRLQLIQGFTADRKDVGQAIIAATETAEKARISAIAQAEKDLIAVAQTGADASGKNVDLKTRALDKTLLAALEDTRHIIQDQHAQLNLAGLMALVRSQQRLSQRKTLIYFTKNEQMDSAGKEMVRSISGAATRAGVSIYAVDMDALNSLGYQAANAQVLGVLHFQPNYTGVGPVINNSPSAQLTGPPPVRDGDLIDSKQEAYNTFASLKSPIADLARDTGGLYIDAQENLKKPLKQMLEDMTTYYQASYISPINDYDGKFRSITIKSVRPGVQIHTRSGYFALPPEAEDGIRPFEVPLLKLFTQAQLPAELNYRTSILRFGSTPNGNANALAVEVPLSELEIREDTRNNLTTAHVAIVAEIKDSTGAVIEHFGEDITRRGTVEKDGRDKSGVVMMQRHFYALPGKYMLEVAVLDLNSEKKCAQRISFEIPSDPSAPSLSDMVLVRKMDAIHDDSDPLDPMHFEEARVTANLSGIVQRDGKPLSLFLMLHPDPNATAPPTLQMEVSLNGKAAQRVTLPTQKDLHGETLPYLATLGSGSLPAGLYEVKAILTQDGKSVSQAIMFTVPDSDADAGGTASPVTEASLKATAIDPYTAGQLAITVPTNPVPPPSRAEIDSILADARVRAVNYADSLPNLLCIEVTNRSVDHSASGRWRARDNITELLGYVDKVETRTTLEVNGSTSSVDREGIPGAFSSGEFGGALKIVFLNDSKTVFHWKETDDLGTGTVQVFEYKVDKANSSFTIVDMGNRQITAGFHGLVFIDTATRSTRRLTLIADDIPATFLTHSTSMAVDYDNVLLNAHDYLVPVSAEMSLLQGKHEAVLNNIVFRDYRLFSSTSKLVVPPDQQEQ
ncbi:MAG: VWA domain-containing protein [Terracidiphilus sp.]